MEASVKPAKRSARFCSDFRTSTVEAGRKGAPSAKSIGRARRRPGPAGVLQTQGTFLLTSCLQTGVHVLHIAAWTRPATPPPAARARAATRERGAATHLRHVCGGQTPIPETPHSQAAERDSRGSRKRQQVHLLGWTEAPPSRRSTWRVGGCAPGGGTSGVANGPPGNRGRR